MKTIEQLKQEAASYAIREAGELLDRCLEPIPPAAPMQLVQRRMSIERALELAFLAGWQAGRGGTL